MPLKVNKTVQYKRPNAPHRYCLLYRVSYFISYCNVFFFFYFFTVFDLKTKRFVLYLLVQDGQVQTVEAVLGHGLTLQCHLPDMEDKSGLTIRWQRWATHRGAVHDDAELTAERVVRRRRHHRRRSRRLIHQSTGSALRFASISEEDEGLYRCVASSTSSSVDNIETSVDDEGRDQSFNDTQNDRHSLVSKPTLDQLDVDNATSVSAINDVEQQSGEAAALTSSIAATDTTSTVYGSFIYLRIQGK